MNLNDREKLVEALLNGNVTVTFQKVNSDEVRVMPCTLNADFLVSNNIVEKASLDNLNEELKPHISVWALDSVGWRSFRFENVLSWEVLSE